MRCPLEALAKNADTFSLRSVSSPCNGEIILEICKFQRSIYVASFYLVYFISVNHSRVFQQNERLQYPELKNVETSPIFTIGKNNF